MNPSLQHDILHRLSEFNFKHEKGGYLRGGTCPQCQKKELYINATHPWMLRCGRLNNCAYEEHVKQIYPDLFNDWSKRYAELIPQNPHAVADAYLQHGRGFDLSKIRGTYTQESYFDSELKIGSATIRFSVGTGYWERLIDKPERFGKKKARFSYASGYQGLWWISPSTLANLPTIKELWLVEGIFDAIALEHHGIAAAALMSCNNYPGHALQKLKESSNMKCRLVWALDDATLSEESRRKKAIYASHSIRPIANCNPIALYYQKNELTDEAWYYFRVDFPHDGASVKNTFTSAQISSASEFKKRLLARV